MPLPKKHRLDGKKNIDNVFKRGRTVKGSFLFIKGLDNPRGYSRSAFIVPSKHISLAVDRNKIKRILSGEIAKILLPERGYDVIVVIYKKIERERFKELGEELRKVLSKISNSPNSPNF